MEADSVANCQSKARLLESPDKSKWQVLETEKRLAGLKPEIGSPKGSVSISDKFGCWFQEANNSFSGMAQATISSKE